MLRRAIVSHVAPACQRPRIWKHTASQGRRGLASAVAPPPPPLPSQPMSMPPNLKLADWSVLQPKPAGMATRRPARKAQSLGALPALPPSSALAEQAGMALDAITTTSAVSRPAAPSMQIWVRSLADPQAKLEELTLDPDVFGQPMRRDVVHEVIRWQRAKRRQGSARAKTISQVSGSGRKVRRQKGSGRARAGHSRPPHWRGGAVAHGPKEHDWTFKLNRKFIKLGLKVALSARLREGCLAVVSDFAVASPKTGALERTLRGGGWHRDTLFLGGAELPPDFCRASRNLAGKGVKALPTAGANVFDVVKRERLVLSVDGVHRLQEVLSSSGKDKAAASGEAGAEEAAESPAVGASGAPA
ncbi:unnamed protein product [Phaeothamnion confervicola]